MHTTVLRKVGGSVMLAVPPALLEALSLSPGAQVRLAIANGKLVIEPKPKQRYSLRELLAASDYSEAPSADEREWIDAPAVGREPF
jgi:antitoxin ChpS